MHQICKILLFSLLLSCSEIEPKVKDTESRDYEIRVIDNCEYIILSSYVSGGWKVESITHKGDCKSKRHYHE